MPTKQEEFWTGQFGQEYTERNAFIKDNEWDEYYIQNYGLSKIDMNLEFIKYIPKNSKILEVGCNVGLQLIGLKRMGFTNLYGIELQKNAVEKAKEYTKDINIIQGSAFDLPFKDNYFYLVFTSGVLIHISPSDLTKVMEEMIRVSNKYIWGFEYYADEVTEINYRGNKGFLWKADYADIFLKNYKGLNIINKKIYNHISDSNKKNKDCMYLLKKI